MKLLLVGHGALGPETARFFRMVGRVGCGSPSFNRLSVCQNLVFQVRFKEPRCTIATLADENAPTYKTSTWSMIDFTDPQNGGGGSFGANNPWPLNTATWAPINASVPAAPSGNSTVVTIDISATSFANDPKVFFRDFSN